VRKCLQCFDTVGWVAGRASGVKKLSGEVLAWLSVWNEVQTCILPSRCHCHSLSLAPVKSRLVSPFWYRPTRVVPDKGLLNGCACVCGVCWVDWTGCTVLLIKCSMTAGCRRSYSTTLNDDFSRSLSTLHITHCLWGTEMEIENVSEMTCFVGYS